MALCFLLAVPVYINYQELSGGKSPYSEFPGVEKVRIHERITEFRRQK